MPSSVFVSVMCILLLAQYAGRSTAGETASDAALTAAIQAAKDDPNYPFRLDVNCNNDGQIRSLGLYRGRIAVLNRTRQVTLAPDERMALLDSLLDAGFPDFEETYGGRPKNEKQEAPLKVSCRIALEIAGMKKTSVQLFDAEQSADLLGLADRILDDVEKLAETGVEASDLGDGLDKIARGILAPDLLDLRLVSLPADAQTQDGYILRVEAAVISRQAYAPGRVIGTPQATPMTNCQMELMIDALRDSSFDALPQNLHRADTTELDVGVLGHRKSIIARAGFPAASNEEQAAFATLMDKLGEQPVDCQPSQ